jgi:hypothetical protein
VSEVHRTRGPVYGCKTYDEDAVRLAVLAHVRHTGTSYDELLASGLDRREARRQVEDQVRFILTTWQQP